MNRFALVAVLLASGLGWVAAGERDVEAPAPEVALADVWLDLALTPRCGDDCFPCIDPQKHPCWIDSGAGQAACDGEAHNCELGTCAGHGHQCMNEDEDAQAAYADFKARLGLAFELIPAATQQDLIAFVDKNSAAVSFNDTRGVLQFGTACPDVGIIAQLPLSDTQIEWLATAQ